MKTASSVRPADRGRPSAPVMTADRRRRLAVWLLVAWLTVTGGSAVAQGTAGRDAASTTEATLGDGRFPESQWRRELEAFATAREAARRGAFDQSRRVLETLEIPVVRVSVLRELAKVYLDRDDPVSAREPLREAARLTDEIAALDQRRLCYLDLAVLLSRAQDLPASREAFADGARLSRESGSLGEQAAAVLDIVRTQAHLGDFSGAMATARRHSDVVGERNVSLVVTEQLIQAVRPLARPGSFEAAMALVEPLEDWRPRISGLALIGAAYQIAEQPLKATEVFESAVAQAEALRRPEERIEAMRAVALEMLRSDYPGGVDLMAQVMATIGMDADRESIPRQISDTVQLVSEADSLETAGAVIEQQDSAWVQTLGYVFVGRRLALRGQLNRATMNLLSATDSAGRIRNAADQDIALIAIAEGFEQIGTLQMAEDKIREGRAAFQRATEAASEIIDESRRDERLASLVRSIAEARDFTTASSSAALIEDPAQRREAEDYIERLSR